MSWFRDCSYYINNNLFRLCCVGQQETRCFSRRGFLSNTYKQTHSALTSYMLDKQHLLHQLHLNNYFMAPQWVVQTTVCSAYMLTISQSPGSPPAVSSRCPIWAVMIKRKSLKVKSTGFFLQRLNLVVTVSGTSLCSAVLSYWTTYTVLCRTDVSAHFQT